MHMRTFGLFTNGNKGTWGHSGHGGARREMTNRGLFMKRSFAAFLSLAAILVASSANAAEEGRFDAQVFRPLAAPRDLVMVPKSEVIGHLSPVVGLYWDAALDPLALVVGDTNKTLDVVGARLQI